MRVHSDDRRTAYCDLFEGTPGDVNLFIVKPGQRTAWHRHQKQTDHFRCIRGQVHVRKFGPQMAFTVGYLLDNPAKLFEVQPGFWHGYENTGEEDAYLLMYLSSKYDPTDEERLSEDEEPWSPT